MAGKELNAGELADLLDATLTQAHGWFADRNAEATTTVVEKDERKASFEVECFNPAEEYGLGMPERTFVVTVEEL